MTKIEKLRSRHPSMNSLAGSIAGLADKTRAGHTPDGAVDATTQEPACTAAVYEDLADLPDHYAQLFSRAGKTSLFFTLPWFRNFARSVLAPNERLRLYAIEVATNPVTAHALLAMYYRRTIAGALGPRRLRSLSNYYTSLFGPILDSDEGGVQTTLDMLVAAIAGDELRWDVIDLHPLATAPPSSRALIQPSKMPVCWCGHTSASATGIFAWRAALTRNTMRRCRRSSRARLPARHGNSGAPARRESSSAGMPPTSMRACVRTEQIYAASWKTTEPYPEFIRGLCRTCAESGWLRLGLVYLDEQPVAAQIWIVANGVASIYKLAYDERFARLSAGSVLTAHLMEHVIDIDKVHEVDYLTGDDAYKKDWMSDRRERWGLVAFNLRSPYGLLAASRHVGGRAVRRTVDALRSLGRGARA